MCKNTTQRIWTLAALVFSMALADFGHAEPAPVGVTDVILTDITPTTPTAEARSAVLTALAEAAREMGWVESEALSVVDIYSFGIPEGTATQVVLGSFELGDTGVVFIMTQDAGTFQRMTQTDLTNYGGKSAFFPSGRLTVAVLHKDRTVKPQVELQRIRILHDRPVLVYSLRAPESVKDLRAPLPENIQELESSILSSEIESLCGSDDRIGSQDRRIGRLMPVGCTGWLIQNNLALTAGHCDVGERMDILEFQVPSSSTDGATQPAHPNDQYPVLRATIQKEYAGIGDDWAVFEVGPNSNTGKLPGDQQGGHFKLSRTARPNAVRVTGYGVDNTPPGSGGGRNKDSQTQQTEYGSSTGGANLTYFPNPGGGSYFRYTIDTTGGNSGSPVIDSDSGDTAAIAIHTNAGCESGGNHGTAADNEDLRLAIEGFVGDLSKVYVD